MTSFETLYFNMGLGLLVFAIVGGFIAIRTVDFFDARERRREATQAPAAPPPPRNP